MLDFRIKFEAPDLAVGFSACGLLILTHNGKVGCTVSNHKDMCSKLFDGLKMHIGQKRKTREEEKRERKKEREREREIGKEKGERKKERKRDRERKERMKEGNLWSKVQKRAKRGPTLCSQ